MSARPNIRLASAILIVEDESIIALDMKRQIEELGYQVVGTAESGAQALQMVRLHAPSLVLMDIRLKGPMDGIEAADRIRREHRVPVVFLTSHTDTDTVQRAADAAPYGYLTKPFQIKELYAGIEVALTKSSMERQLREADRWFASTLRCVHDGVIVTGLDARIRFLNPAAEALLGLTLAEALGRPVAEVVRYAPPQPQGNAALQALREGRVIGVAHARQLAARGRTVAVDESAGPVDDETGSRIGAVLVLRDATERMRQEAEQKQAAEQLAQLAEQRMKVEAGELANRARSEFFSRASHEMRTPLNAVLGFAQLMQMQDSLDQAKTQMYAGHLLKAGQHLLALVDDVLDLQRAAEGRLQLRMTAVVLHACVGDAVELLQPMAREHRIEFAIDVPAGLCVRADETRLRQVLLNLGSNAVKYNRPGGRVRWTAHAAPDGRVYLTIADTGTGMTPEQMQRLFQPFERLGRETSSIPGSGLGLLIARTLVEAMDATMTLASAPHEGTRVELQFAAG